MIELIISRIIFCSFVTEYPLRTAKLFFSIELNNKEISRGGEYNNLMKTLGYKKQINAFGGAIDLNQLLN